MILYLNRQTLETWFFGHTFRNSPTLEHAALSPRGSESIARHEER